MRKRRRDEYGSNEGPAGPVKLDPLDWQLMSRLRANGRRANRDLARELGVAEATVRNHLRRLIDQECIQIVAATNPLKLGYQVDAVIGLHVDNRRVRAVADKLAQMEEVRYASITVGAYDIIIAAFFPTHNDLLEFLTAKLGRIPGIRKTETSLSMKLVKRSYDWMSTERLRGSSGAGASDGLPTRGGADRGRAAR
jgi:Lrp/AsnC family transcriptional regulator for asnA, asnC and gidA